MWLTNTEYHFDNQLPGEAAVTNGWAWAIRRTTGPANRWQRSSSNTFYQCL